MLKKCYPILTYAQNKHYKLHVNIYFIKISAFNHITEPKATHPSSEFIKNTVKSEILQLKYLFSI